MFKCLLIFFRALFRRVRNSKINLEVKLMGMITVFRDVVLSSNPEYSVTSQKTIIITGFTVRTSGITLLMQYFFFLPVFEVQALNILQHPEMWEDQESFFSTDG